MKKFMLLKRLIAPVSMILCAIFLTGQSVKAQSRVTLFVANTTCDICNAVPAVGLANGAGTLTPATASLSGASVTFGATTYGNVPKFGGGNGGPTGWIHVTYSAPAAGTYSLLFQVSHVGDTQYPSALAIDNLQGPITEGFESGVPNTWAFSGPAGLDGVATSTSGITPTQGTQFAWISTGCTFSAGTTCPTVAALTSSYLSLYGGAGTNGLPVGQALGVPAVGTALESPSFTIPAGGVISFDVNFITTDGTYGFADFATVQLVPTPESGDLLEIDGTISLGAANTPVHLKVYDSQVHTGVVQVPALAQGASPAGNCVFSDEIPTDADVMQAESTTGCNPGPSGEANLTSTGSFKFVSPAGSPVAYEFDVSTQFVCAPLVAGACGAPTVCSHGDLICSNQSGFLTITNNAAPGSTFSGTIKLSGTPGNLASCVPDPLTDTVTSGLGPGVSAILALSANAASCGGFNSPQTQTLVAGQTNTFPFGNDIYTFTPFNSNAGDTLSFLPIPVPAGPLGFGAVPPGAPAPGQFGSEAPVSSPLTFSATNFPGQACAPASDFSALGNPVCSEIQLNCTGADCTTFLYSGQFDFPVDANSLPNGIGGVHFLGDQSDQCPTSNFNIDNLSFAKGGDIGVGHSGNPLGCFAVTFEPTAAPIAVGQIVKQQTFGGFQAPVVSCSTVPCVRDSVMAGSTIPLIWETKDSAGNPVQLNFCGNTTGSGCTPPWVFLGYVGLSCASDMSTAQVLDDTAGASGLQYNAPFNQFNWKTSKSQKATCATPVLGFSTGFWSFDVAEFAFK